MILSKRRATVGSPVLSTPLLYDIQYGSPYSLPCQWRPDYPSLPSQLTFYTIFSIKCEQEISDCNYIPIIPCNTTTTTGYYSSSSPTYGFAVFGEYVRLGDIPYSCTIDTYMIIQPLKIISRPRNLSDDTYFQPELGWSVFGLLGRSWADTGLVCRLCVVGSGIGLLLLLIGRLWMWHSPAKRTRKKKDRRGFRPWPLRCLSQFLFERKD